MELPPLHFHGPYPLCSEESDALAECEFREQAGVYLWVAKQLTGSYRIEYIGETKCFVKRIRGHINEVLCGNYRIPDSEKRREGNQTLVWRGLLHPSMRGRSHEFIRDYQKVAPAIAKYLLTSELFFAPCECERRMRQRIEGALAKYLCSVPLAATIFQADVRYQPRSAKEIPVVMSFTTNYEIEGLPSSLDV